MAETQAEGEAGSMHRAWRGTRSRISRITPWAAGGAKPLRHRGCLIFSFLWPFLSFSSLNYFEEYRSGPLHIVHLLGWLMHFGKTPKAWSPFLIASYVVVSKWLNVDLVKYVCRVSPLKISPLKIPILAKKNHHRYRAHINAFQDL